MVLATYQTYIITSTFGEKFPSLQVSVAISILSFLCLLLIPLTFSSDDPKRPICAHARRGLKDGLKVRTAAATLFTLWALGTIANTDRIGTGVLFSLVPLSVLLVLLVRPPQPWQIGTLLQIWALSAAVFIMLSGITGLIFGFPESILMPAQPRRIWHSELLGFEVPRLAGPYGGHALSGLTAALLILVASTSPGKVKLLVLPAGLIMLFLTESRNAVFAVMAGVAIMVFPRERTANAAEHRLQRFSRAMIILVLCASAVAIISKDLSLNGRLDFIRTPQATPLERVATNPNRDSVHSLMTHNSLLTKADPVDGLLAIFYIAFLLYCLFQAIKQARGHDRRSLILVGPMTLTLFIDGVLAPGSVSILAIGWLLTLLQVSTGTSLRVTAVPSRT